MKKTLIFAWGLLVIGVNDAKCSGLSVFGAIGEALGNNPNVEQAEARIAQAEARIDETNSAWWPWVSTDLSYTRADAPSVYLFKAIDQHGLQPGTDFNSPGTLDDFEMGVRVDYALYRGGRKALDRRVAEHDRADAQAYKESIENELIGSVIRWYFRSLATEELVESAIQTRQTVEAELRDATTRYEAGAALKSDVLQLRVRSAEAEQELIGTRNEYTMSLETLANLLGRDGAAGLSLSGERWWPRDIPDSAEDAIPSAMESRPELTRAELALEKGRLNRTREQRMYLPDADLSFRTYGNDDDLGYSGDDVNWAFGVGARWSVFEGGRRAARIRASDARIREMEAALRRAGLRIRLDVTDAYVRLSDARARFDVAIEAVTHAEENLRLVRDQFEQGAATVTRYLEAERDLTHARVREISARYERDDAHANVGRALGWCHECIAATGDAASGSASQER